jgi:hypothetical protein
MTQHDLQQLQPGDIIRHVGHGEAYMVTGNYGERITAVRTIDVTNPIEWVLVGKASYTDLTP